MTFPTLVILGVALGACSDDDKALEQNKRINF
jgi:hypothetical protein